MTESLGEDRIKHMNQNGARKVKKYDETFRRQALEHWRRTGKSAEEVAGALGITTFSLYSWRRKYELLLPQGGRGSSSSPLTLEEENAALRKELEHVREQRDILKKTLGIVCNKPNNATNESKS